VPRAHAQARRKAGAVTGADPRLAARRPCWATLAARAGQVAAAEQAGRRAAGLAGGSGGRGG
jgi:hypothetical protein